MITELDPYKTPFSTALQIADILLDAFQDDELHGLMHGPKYTFPVPPPAGALRQYRQLRWSWGARQWLRIRDPNFQCFLLTDGDKPIGFTAWIRPDALRVEEGPMLHRFKSWLFEKWYRLKCYFMFWREPFWPGQNPEVNEYFDEVGESTGMKTPKVPVKELAHLSWSELANTPYPGDDLSWCAMMAVRKSCQGKGYGGKLFRHAMDNLGTDKPIFKDGTAQSQGPAKLGLLSTPVGLRFYESMGFKVTYRYGKVVQGVNLDGPLMIKVLESPDHLV